MSIDKVVVRKPVSLADKLAGVSIIMAIDTERLNKMRPRASLKDTLYCLDIYTKLSKAAKLLGFDSFESMNKFMDMFGVDALMQ